MPTIKKTAPKTAAKKVVATKSTPPKKDAGKRVQKVVSLLISVGDEDRERDMDEFVAELTAAVKKCGGGMPKGEIRNVTKTQEYYIVDGKVCLRQSFDLITKDFKEGHFPPAWAGGPTDKEIKERITRQSTASPASQDPIGLETADEYKRRSKSPRQALEEIKQDRVAVSERISGKIRAEQGNAKSKAVEEDIEEFSDEDFEWDHTDVGSSKVDAAADDAVESARKALAAKKPIKKSSRGRK